MMLGVTACYQGVEHDPVLDVSFDLPPDWEVIYDEPGYTSIGLSSPTKDGNSPHVKLESIPLGVFLGTSEDARRYVEDLNVGLVPAASEPPPVEVTTMVLINGVEVFADVSPHAFWGHPSWETQFAFSTGSYVVTMYINDDIRLYPDEINQIVQSAHVKEL